MDIPTNLFIDWWGQQCSLPKSPCPIRPSSVCTNIHHTSTPTLPILTLQITSWFGETLIPSSFYPLCSSFSPFQASTEQLYAYWSAHVTQAASSPARLGFAPPRTTLIAARPANCMPSIAALLLSPTPPMPSWISGASPKAAMVGLRPSATVCYVQFTCCYSQCSL